MLDVGALAADRKCLVLPVVVAMFITSLWTTTIITTITITITITITTTQLPCYFDFVSHSGLLTHNLSHSEVLQNMQDFKDMEAPKVLVPEKIITRGSGGHWKPWGP